MLSQKPTTPYFALYSHLTNKLLNMTTKDIIMNYWKSWHSHDNWKETRSYMADDFEFNSSELKTTSADELIKIMKKGNAWKDISLLDSVIEDNKAALLYEGTDSVTGTKYRISEILTVEDGKVSYCTSTTAEVPNKD